MRNLSPSPAASPATGLLTSCKTITSLVVATAVALSPLGQPRIASAAPSETAGAVQIEILSMASNDAVDEAAALTDAFKHALIEAAGMADNGHSHALEAIALSVGCDDPMAATCAPKIAAEIKANRFIYGSLKKSLGGKLTATLHYYDNGQIKTVVKTYDAGPMAKDGTSPELKKIALEALYQLVGGPPKGEVGVTVMGPGASADGDLFEGSTKIGHVTNGKASLQLPSGHHTLELRMSGYAIAIVSIEVTPTGTTAKFAPVKLAPPTPIDWQLYGGLGAIAVGVVFVGLGVSASLATNDAGNDPILRNYRTHFDESEKDTCARAREGNPGTHRPLVPASEIAEVVSICDKAQSKQRQQYIFYPLGGLFIAGGAILIFTDKHGDAESAPGKTAKRTEGVSVRVQPTFGPSYGSLSLVGRF